MSDHLVEEVTKPGASYHRVGRTTASGMRVFGEDGHQRHESRADALKAAGAEPEPQEQPTHPQRVFTQGAAPDIVGPTGIPNQQQVEKTEPANERDPKAEEEQARKRKEQVQREQDKAGLNAPSEEDDKDEDAPAEEPKGKREHKADAQLQAETDDALAHERDAKKPKRGRKPKQPGVDDNMPEVTGPDRA